jgi:hypothetical protein
MEYKNPLANNAVTADFRQSTFWGFPMTMETVRKKSGSHIPQPNRKSQIDAFVLQSMDGAMTQVEIAKRIMEAFSREFESWQHALSHVGKLSTR